jgi:glycosyltransferase involved in cell wall biosynthesis
MNISNFNLNRIINKNKKSSNSLPKISIFLPIYNKAEYLYRSIKSIQFQTLKNLEIISVNDCSEDDTLEVLLKLAKNDKRIKIINNKKNMGLKKIWNIYIILQININ